MVRHGHSQRESRLWSAGLPHLVNLNLSANRPIGQWRQGQSAPLKQPASPLVVVCHPTANQNQTASQQVKVCRLVGCCLTARLGNTGQSGRSSGGLWQSKEADSLFSRTKADSRVTQPDQSAGHSQLLPVGQSPLVAGSSSVWPGQSQPQRNSSRPAS